MKALHGVSLTVGEGEIVAVLGGNGAGKTTTLRAISGLVTMSGEVRFAGERITRAAPERVARIGIAHVPEGRGIFSELSVRENLRLGAYLRRDGFDEGYERVRGYFPWLEERQRPAGGHALRRRAADARARPGAHGAAADCCCSTSRPSAWRRSSSARSSASSAS